MSEIVYGIHTVKAILRSNPESFKKVFILKEKIKKNSFLSLIQTFKDHNIMIQPVSRQFLKKKSENSVHQGIVAYVKKDKKYTEKNLLDLIKKITSPPFLLILDGITDPHNLGACLRSAYAAGVNAVIIPKNRSARLNSTVKKVSCGAAENIPIVQVVNLARFLKKIKEEKIRILGTSTNANRILYQSKMTGSIAIVMGSEKKGIRRLTQNYCDELISIPIIGDISSLNVSVATGIFLFEAVRQKGIIFEKNVKKQN